MGQFCTYLLPERVFKTHHGMGNSEHKVNFTLLSIQSSLYVWIIFLTGIFYTLPVLQMIAEHQSTSNSTGNLDLCYYNYLCKVGLGSILDTASEDTEDTAQSCIFILS